MELKELVKRINESPEWNPEDLKELCTMAGMVEAWEIADGENFEEVVYQAAERSGVDILGGVTMLRLIEKNEGKEKVWAVGSVAEIIQWLKDNPEIYTWVLNEDPDVVMPSLDYVTTLRELQYELSCVDLSWWTLEVQ